MRSPRFAVSHRLRARPAWALAAVAGGLALYGVVSTLQLAGS